MPPKKATQEQYQLLVEQVGESSCLKWGKGTLDQKKEEWSRIGAVLNSVGGVEKTPEGWKKAFVEMKSHIKSKIRNGKDLNAIEKKCAEIAGLNVLCSGMSSVEELGVEPQGKSEEPLQDEVAEETVEENVKENNAVNVNDEDADRETGSHDVPVTSKSKSKPKSTYSIKKKTLSEQYEMYIHFKKCKHHNEEAFETLCSELNTIRNGPKRSTLNWKKIFSEWESKVKAKARRIYMEREITGGGVPIIEILNDLERRLLEVLSKVLIYGHPKVIELGFLKCKKLKRAPPTIVARKLYKRKRHLSMTSLIFIK
ncbi:hypothetical protein PPYR_01875 [Photinus pyralis]|uniref:Regulatory protein zeste n=1 Tax=Photinus pyralis TaxID=7054 RepID=A0A1Y1LBL1_PHOPY|nr:hypothetical protein PPYR_11777 [Photinus pyralis]KAB0804905.1 hypothetical protein PPYR_01875 [Photinus pyralis]